MSRRSQIAVAAALGVVASVAVVCAGSFVACPLVSAFDTCKKIPVCSAAYVNTTQGPSWSCASRFAR